MLPTPLRPLALLAGAAVMLACSDSADTPAGDPAGEAAPAPSTPRLPQAPIRIVTAGGTLAYTVELAVTTDEKTMGLMERTQLPDTAGMLFVYDSLQPPDAGFWMFRTRIPLDIAFMDSAGVIRSIRTMVPCETTIAQGCPVYPPGVPYQYALEVNGGAFAAKGVKVGDSVDVAAALARSGQ